MSSVFELPALPTVAIAGTDKRFPVGRVFCVGRNYAAHAREMGGNPDREPPFFFTKFPQTIVPGGGTIPYPPQTSDYHHEAELVIAIGKAGAALDVKSSLDIVFGYAAGLDMTRRDLQGKAKEQGRPWDLGKNFAFAGPIGTIRPVEGHGHADSGAIVLTVNGNLKQEADLKDLIWNNAEIVSYLSQFERLLPGDLIYTGTPAGVAAVVAGDVLELTIAGLEPLKVTIGERESDFK